MPVGAGVGLALYSAGPLSLLSLLPLLPLLPLPYRCVPGGNSAVALEARPVRSTQRQQLVRLGLVFAYKTPSLLWPHSGFRCAPGSP